MIAATPVMATVTWARSMGRNLAIDTGHRSGRSSLPGRPEGPWSGGFAANPVESRLGRAKIGSARFLPGPLYRHLTLRLHASALASPHDGEGQVALDRHDFRQLFLENTPWHAYVARATAAFSADYRSQLSRVDVPTLIVTPSHDELIGANAAQTMLEGISEAAEVVLERTGHMFRFTHPHTYAAAVEEFIAATVATPMDQLSAEPTVAKLPGA